MTQDILTYIIITLAITFTLYRLYKSFIARKKVISGCAGCSKGCEIKKIVDLRVRS